MIYIILSTYNGASYLHQQLDSILKQSIKDFILLIRDDGSTDKTLEILNEYAEQYKNIKLIKGKNIGVVASFFELVNAVPENADFLAS